MCCMDTPDFETVSGCCYCWSRCTVSSLKQYSGDVILNLNKSMCVCKHISCLGELYFGGEKSTEGEKHGKA